MTERPVGPVVADFTAPPAPGPARIEGRYVTLERLDPARHAADLFAANRGQDWVWDYMPYGPFLVLAGLIVYVIGTQDLLALIGLNF